MAEVHRDDGSRGSRGGTLGIDVQAVSHDSHDLEWRGEVPAAELGRHHGYAEVVLCKRVEAVFAVLGAMREEDDGAAQLADIVGGEGWPPLADEVAALGDVVFVLYDIL